MSLPVTIRPAREEDLPAVFDVFWDNEVGDRPNPPPRADVPAFFRHEIETGDMLVAEREGRVVGFASLITRGSISYLAELFVRRDKQSAQIGKTLLQRVLPTDGRTIFTLSSRDPRALSLYIRAGMRARWPSFWLRAETTPSQKLAQDIITTIEAQPGDPDLTAWDAEISGRYRPQDHRAWIDQDAVPLWFEREGRRVGYGYVQMRRGSIWTPEAVTVGPVGARTPDDALLCACATVHYAGTRADVVRLDIPGPHPALAASLDAGFRIVDVETFVSTSPQPFADPERYIGSPDVF